ncbi:MAG: pyridoxine 5'-phosphate synthase, partial [Muribaculaceae bacterium]|nr:pyridoxine 5'-phosphate synthase [Muribaculaceae bacterium]
HIRRSDVYELKPVLHTEFNIEGFPDKRFMDMVLEVRPHQATLVPDAPSVLTSSQGWPVAENQDFLTTIVARLHEAGIRVSIFVDATEERVRQAAMVGADRVELYTGPFAQIFTTSPEQAVAPYHNAALVAHEVGLGLNAGHDLNLHNLKFFKDNVPYLDEVSIGHALISDALYLGLENTIQAYKACLI